MSKVKAYQYVTDRKTKEVKRIKHYADRTEATKIMKAQDIWSEKVDSAEYIVRFDGVVIRDYRSKKSKAKVIGKPSRPWFTPYRDKLRKALKQ